MNIPIGTVAIYGCELVEICSVIVNGFLTGRALIVLTVMGYGIPFQVHISNLLIV